MAHGNAVNFVFDGNNRVISAGNLALTRELTSGVITGHTQGLVTATVGYNLFAEPSVMESKAGASTLLRQDFTRDKLGRIVSKLESIDGVNSVYDYSYDVSGRLNGVKKNGTVISSYGYDLNNNRISATVGGQSYSGAYDAQDRIISYGANSYVFSSHGDLVSKTNSSSGITSRYNYDLFGQLKRAEVSPTLLVEYLTDGEGHRIQTKVNSVITKNFVYNENGQLIGELDSGNILRSQFVYATQSHSPDFMIRQGVDYLFIKDHLGSIRLVVNTSSGAVVQRMDYDEFGRVLADSNPGFQPFGFAGGIYDENTGLVRFGARDYDAEVGRWTSKDPILQKSDDSNLYGYASTDPVNYLDPEGKSSMPAIYPPEGAPDERCNKARSCQALADSINLTRKCIGALCLRIPNGPAVGICIAGSQTFLKSLEAGVKAGCEKGQGCPTPY